MSDDLLALPDDYEALLQDLKSRIQQAQLRASTSVNRELLLLYWKIGSDILARQEQQGWGARIVDRLSIDLHVSFPEMKGLSARNLKYMRAFATAWPDIAIVQEPLAQLTWYHNLTLIEKLKSREERLWYAKQAIQNGWSRAVLVHQIETGLQSRQGSALTNFSRTLPEAQSELAQQLIKDPYHFDFLGLAPDLLERDLERGLIDHVRDFLLELGKGFAFVGSQYHLEVGGQDYYLDLLFYHIQLRCFVVVDLKIEEFKPEFAGKMNFYLSAVDDLVRHKEDKPSIGIILCKDRNEIVVEYALRDTSKPMGVAKYLLTSALPDGLKEALPTAHDLVNEFPLLSLLKLRIEIEQALSERARNLGCTDELVGIPRLLGWLKRNDRPLLGADDFLRVLGAINQAAHGRRIDSEAAQEATQVGTAFLHRILDATT